MKTIKNYNEFLNEYSSSEDEFGTSMTIKDLEEQFEEIMNIQDFEASSSAIRELNYKHPEIRTNNILNMKYIDLVRAWYNKFEGILTSNSGRKEKMKKFLDDKYPKQTN